MVIDLAMLDELGTGLRPGAAPARRRCLMLSRVGFLGGVERVALTLAADLKEQAWETVLACPDGGALAEAARARRIALAPIPFDRMRITADPRVLARYPRAWLEGSRAVERRCREHAVDLIHAHHPVTALYARRATRRLGIPMVLHVHETLPARPLYAAAMRLAVRGAAMVLCVSGAALRLALATGADPARTRVVHNGVDPRFLERREPDPAPGALRAAGPGPHVGVFGVLEPRKAQHVFLEAAAMLADRFPTARFWLIGPAALRDKQSYVERLRRMAEAPPLRGRVALVGFQADVAPWLAGMDVVVQTSVAYESFGMALAEALALGRPVVATQVGGMPEVVREGETGLIVPPGDAAALAAALRRLLEAPETRRAFGVRGAADARRRFAPAVFCRAVADAYDAVLASGPGRS
jgi:glycosyltransferase involved in cell wall biosynthesis